MRRKTAKEEPIKATEGMLAEPPALTGTVRIMNLSKGNSLMQHVVPTEQFVHLVDKDGECMCGPDMEKMQIADGSIIARYVHRPLDNEHYFDYSMV